MNLIDAIIIIILLLFGVIGFKRGIIKEIVVFIGVILVLFLSYKLKNIIGDILVLKLPFITMPDLFLGASSLNIIFYQAIGFLITLIILTLLWKILISISGIFERILRFTIVLGIPSKLLGLLLGLVEGYVIAFCGLFIINQPFFDHTELENSKYAYNILNNAPILSDVTENGLETFEEIYSLTKIDDQNELDKEIVSIVLKREITDIDTIEELISDGKLNIDGIDVVLNRYR